MLARSHIPIAVNEEKPTCHVREFYVSTRIDLPTVLIQTTFQRRIESFACVYKLPLKVQCVYAFPRWCYVNCQRMLGTGLKLFDQLSRVGLVKFKHELMFVAHNRKLSSLGAVVNATCRKRYRSIVLAHLSEKSAHQGAFRRRGTGIRSHLRDLNCFFHFPQR